MNPDEVDSARTRPTLLSKVRRGDEDGWNQFYELYEDFIYSAARGAGLSHEESRDVVQEAMISVRDYINHFEPDESRGRFRTWLRKLVQSRIADRYRRKKRNPLDKAEPRVTSDDAATSTTNRIPDLNEVELDRLIDGKLEQAILAEAQKSAKEKVRMEHYQAYDLFDIHELSAQEVAISLGISGYRSGSSFSSETCGRTGSAQTGQTVITRWSPAPLALNTPKRNPQATIS